MFDLVAAGISSEVAANVVDLILNGWSIVSALTLVAGLAGGAVAVLEGGLSLLIKWAGRKTVIAY